MRHSSRAGARLLPRDGRQKPCSRVWNCATELLKSCNGIIVKFVENITLNEYAHSECFGGAGKESAKLKAEAFSGCKLRVVPTTLLSHSLYLSLSLALSHALSELPECNHKFLCGMQNNVITLNMQMPFVSHAFTHGKHTHAYTHTQTVTHTKHTQTHIHIYKIHTHGKLLQWRRKW